MVEEIILVNSSSIVLCLYISLLPFTDERSGIDKGVFFYLLFDIDVLPPDGLGIRLDCVLSFTSDSEFLVYSTVVFDHSVYVSLL